AVVAHQHPRALIARNRSVGMHDRSQRSAHPGLAHPYNLFKQVHFAWCRTLTRLLSEPKPCSRACQRADGFERGLGRRTVGMQWCGFFLPIAPLYEVIDPPLPYRSSMKAILFDHHGGPEVLRYTDAPEPEPRSGEVLVRVHACALNHLDLWVRGGLPGL